MLGLRKIHDLGRQSSHSYVGYSFSNPNVRNSFSYSFGGNMNASELAEKLLDCLSSEDRLEIRSASAQMLRQQQAEIDRLHYDPDGFKQNFFVSGFHLQIKMANEQLVKQQEQIEELKSELDRAVELYTDKAIENEALKELLANEGIVVGHDYLNNCIATMRKAQEK